MTKDEFDAIPEIGAIGQIAKIIDGKKMEIPFLSGCGPMWNAESVVDDSGQRWMIGWKDNKLCKQRSVNR